MTNGNVKRSEESESFWVVGNTNLQKLETAAENSFKQLNIHTVGILINFCP